MAHAFGMGILAWSPLGGGVLSGKYDRNRQTGTSDAARLSEGSPSLSEKNLSIAEVVQRIAEEIGRSPSQVGLNWVCRQKGITIRIISARKASQAKDNLARLDSLDLVRS